MTSSIIRLADGAEIHAHVQGHGRDLLLVSGLGGTAAFWNSVVSCLTARFRVIRFDQRGISPSTRGTADVTIDQLARDCFSVLDHFESKNALLIGHSTGGVMIQSMALDSEARIAGLVLSGTWLKSNRYMAELFRSRLALLRAAPREYAAIQAFSAYSPDWLDAHWPQYEALLTQAPMSEAQQVVIAERIHALLKFDRGTEIAGLRLPHLILGAEDDIIVPVFLQRELANVLKQARTYYFSTGGHFFPITRAREFADIFLQWAEAHV